jgi:PrcB C-terminal
MLTLPFIAALMLAASEPKANALVGDKKDGGKNADVKILKKAASSNYRDNAVIRSSEEAAKASATKGTAEEETIKLAKAFNVPTIDWTKQMVIVVYGGERGTGGYSVEVKSLESKDGKLVVHWKLNAPGADDIVAQVISYPSQAILVDRTDAKVVFEQIKK